MADSQSAGEVARRRLGRTGLQVPVISLGTGGPERMGQARGASASDIERFVRSAVEHGIDYLDTAPEYSDSEVLLGHALRGVDRGRVMLATKFRPYLPDGSLQPAAALHESVAASLRRLNTDYVDVVQLHGVEPHHCRAVVERFVPELTRIRERGDTRFLGITEKPAVDPWHETLTEVLSGDSAFDCIMVGHSMLNPTAGSTVVPTASTRDIGVVGMVAVRSMSRWSQAIQREAQRDTTAGRAVRDLWGEQDPVEWLLGDSGLSLAEVGYRFVASTDGVSTVLTGTSDLAHLRANLAAVAAGPLPAEVQHRIESVFTAMPIASVD